MLLTTDPVKFYDFYHYDARLPAILGEDPGTRPIPPYLGKQREIHEFSIPFEDIETISSTRPMLFITGDPEPIRRNLVKMRTAGPVTRKNCTTSKSRSCRSFYR